MTTSTKPKPVELSDADQAAVFAWPRMLRRVLEYVDSGKFMIEEETLDRIKDAVSLLADPYQSWPPERWALLQALNDFVRIAETDPSQRVGSTWKPANLPMHIVAALQKVGGLVFELENPPPPPQPEKRPLESLEELQRQRVSVRQICKILDLVDSNGEPDAKAYAEACAGQREVPTFRLVMPQSNRPTRRPHPGRVEAWANDHLFDRDIDHAQLVGQYLDERDNQRHNAAPESAGRTQNASDGQNESEAVAPKRPRGRPRKSLHLESTGRAQ